MTDLALHGARSPRWRFLHLDHRDRVIGELPGAEGGDCEIVAQSRLGGSGKLTLGGIARTVDWMRDRVQVVYDPGVPGVAAWPVGTFMLASPVEEYSEFGLVYEVGLLPKTQIVDEDSVADRYTLAANALIVNAVVALIQSTGETRITVTESTARTSSAMTWDAGTSKLTIINDLLQAAGYWSLWCDGSGSFMVEPYTNPADRAPSWVFEAGETSIHSPEWSREYDQSSVPNRFIAVGEGDEATPALIGVASNTNPDSPYSYAARGRWITAAEEGVEGATQAILTAYAERRLRALMSPVARMSATHAIVPLNPNDVVEFVPLSGSPRLATVQSMSFKFDFDSDCEAEWREVVPV